MAPVPDPSAWGRFGWNGWGGIQNDASPGWCAGTMGGVAVFARALSPDEVLAEWGGRE